MAGLLGEYAKGLLGFVSDPQSWKDMGRNAVGLLGAPLPTKQEEMAMALRRRMQGSVMRDYPSAETDLANSYREKMTNVALGMNPVLMMAGPKAKTANLAALEQAQKLEQSGAVIGNNNARTFAHRIVPPGYRQCATALVAAFPFFVQACFHPG